MRTKIFFIRIIFLSFVTALFMTQCKKEYESKNKTNPQMISERDLKIVNLAKAFKENLGSKLKEEEEMSVDSALWYIETTLNVFYARGDSAERCYSDSAIVTIPLTDNNTVLLSDVEAAYQALVDSLALHYQNIPFDEKNVLYADIILTHYHTEYIVVKMLDMMGTRGNWQPWPTFGPDDYWYWGLGQGKCDNYQGQFIGIDAAKKLYQYANQFPKSPSSCYTDIETIGPIPAMDPQLQTSGNPFGYEDSYLFAHGSYIYPEYNECLSPQEMNYYLEGLKTAGEIFKPSGKEIISYYCISDLSPGINYWLHFHEATFTYGKLTAVPFPPIIFE